jgi:hypothetical protein
MGDAVAASSAILMVRRAEIAQPDMRFGGDLLRQRLGETRFANTRLSGDQNNPAFAGLRLPPAAQQQVGLLVATDQWRGAGTQCLELAERAVFRHDPPCRHRYRQTFEFDRAEILALEQAANLAAGGGVDHHLTRAGEALQPRREVRCLTDRGLLTRIA